MHALLNHLYHWVGLDGGAYYNAYSGIIPAIVIIGGFWAVLRKHTCVVRGCPRISRHMTAAGHAVCHRHSPLYSGNRAPTVEQVHKAHHEAAHKLDS